MHQLLHIFHVCAPPPEFESLSVKAKLGMRDSQITNVVQINNSRATFYILLKRLLRMLIKGNYIAALFAA